MKAQLQALQLQLVPSLGNMELTAHAYAQQLIRTVLIPRRREPVPTAAKTHGQFYLSKFPCCSLSLSLTGVLWLPQPT